MTKKKSKYKDEPRYKLVRKYEGDMKRSYKVMLADMTVGLVSNMAGMLKSEGRI